MLSPAIRGGPRFTHGEPTQYHRSLRTAKAMTDFVLALDRDPMLEALERMHLLTFPIEFT